MGEAMTDTMTSFADTIDLKPAGPNLWAGQIDPDYREVQENIAHAEKLQREHPFPP